MSADFLDRVPFHGPLGLHRFENIVEVGKFFLQILEPVFRYAVLFFFQCFLLYFKFDPLSFQFIDFSGHRINFNAQHRCRFVDQIDRLIRQKSIGNIAVGKGYGSDGGIVLDPDAVVNFIFFLDTSKDSNGILNRRLLHQHRLKASLQRTVLLDVFAIFIKGRCPDAVQFASGEGRFEHVRGIH